MTFIMAGNKALAQFPRVTVSLGVAWFQKADRNFPSMLKAADKLMYAVKKKGQGFNGIKAFCTALGLSGCNTLTDLEQLCIAASRLKRRVIMV